MRFTQQYALFLCLVNRDLVFLPPNVNTFYILIQLNYRYTNTLTNFNYVNLGLIITIILLSIINNQYPKKVLLFIGNDIELCFNSFLQQQKNDFITILVDNNNILLHDGHEHSQAHVTYRFHYELL